MTTTQPRDLEAELNSWDGEYPPSWKPAAGEVLVGRIIQYGEGPGKYGPVRTAIIERDDGSRVSLWIGSSVLLAEFQKAKPALGERIGVKCLGRCEGKGYWKFRLIVDRPLAEGDFSPLGGEQDGPPEPTRTTDRAVTPYAAATVRNPDRAPRDTRQPAPYAPAPARGPRPAAPTVTGRRGPEPDPNDPFSD